MDAKGKLFLLCTIASLISIGVRGQVCTNVRSNPYTKIWIIATGHNWGAYEYLNEGGYVSGFHSMLIEEVCKAANINCRTMWLPYTACWKAQQGKHSYGGDALLGGWVDACMGWRGTIDRIHTFDFSMSYLRLEESYFYYKKGTTFDKNNIKNSKIGYVAGWSSDDKCVVRRLGTDLYSPSRENVIYYDTRTDLLQAIENGDVYAGFCIQTALEDDLPNYEVAKDTIGYTCGIIGNSLMARKDNDFIHYWNIGFMKIRNNGQFKKLCQEAVDAHGSKGPINCVET